jgi:polysaccharide export outer membrane protein
MKSLFLLCCVLLSALAAGLVQAAPEDASYVLRPNDLIKLDVYGEADLSGSVRILKSGQASFPLIGSVAVSGMSVSDAVAKIRDLYAKKYLVDPKMTLTVEDYATDYVSVIGAVRNPGQIPIPVAGQLDLASAVAAAGGLADHANVNGIQVIRAAGGTTTYTKSTIESSGGGRVQLAAGDRIVVLQSTYVGKTVSILGRVGRPGPVGFPVSGGLDLVNAIAFAGGLTELANPKKITINRKGKVSVVDYREISQRADRPYQLEPGDVVTVAERIF